MPQLKRIWLTINPQAAQAWEALLKQAGLTVDRQVNYTLGLFENGELLATGSLFGSIIKAVAVAPAHRAENLLTPIIQGLLDRLDTLQQTHAFVYTKPATSRYFSVLGFQNLVQTGQISLLEYGYPDFNDYLSFLRQHKRPGSAAAIVMNADPMTKGHLYLIEQAAQANPTVYVFVLSSQQAFFTAEQRLAMVKQATATLTNVVVLPTRGYLVSPATFPSYFLKDQADLNLAKQQALVDAQLFQYKLAPVLQINQRYVGTEPHSPVTAIYNQVLKATLAPTLKLQIVPRLTCAGQVISASAARHALQTRDFNSLEKLIPQTTINDVKECYDHGN